MIEFLQFLAPHIHLVAITPDGPINGKFFGADAAAAHAWATSQNVIGRNLYWTVNIVRDNLDKKPVKSDIIGVRFAHVDIDPPKDGSAWDKTTALSHLTQRGAPSFVIDSGNGLQGIWILDALGYDHGAIETINRGIMTAFHGGDSCWNVDRLLRVPGFTNWPNEKKRAAGRVPEQATIIAPYNGNRYGMPSLAQAFPAPAIDEVRVELTDGPCEGYTGPEDDDELIAMMLASKGGALAIFGSKATVADLWHGRADVLSQNYPDANGNGFDHSAADAALFAHLAFWTGKDAARMDRLFRRSALMREKYEKRETYRTETIRKSVGGCKAIYDKAPKKIDPKLAEVAAQPFTFPTVAEAVKIASETVTAWRQRTTSEILSIPDQVEHFKGCVYVRNDHRILMPDGAMLKSEQFKVARGGAVFIMSMDGSQPSKNAWEAFTENRAIEFPKVARTMFNPGLPFGEIVNDAVNTFLPDTTVKSEPGDVTPMLQHVAKLLPDVRDQEILWSYLASLVQNPGVKFQWAPLIQGAKGNGKSIISEMVYHAIGQKYSHKPNASDLANKFNDFMVGKLFIDVQEISLENKQEIAEILKEWITSDRIEVQPKGGEKRMTDNWANWVFASNHKHALPVDKSERRYAPFFCAQQTVDDIRRCGMIGDYFPSLWNWCRNGGWRYLTHYLRTREINPDFDPAGNGEGRSRAPITSSFGEATRASMGAVEQEITEAVESFEPGFRDGWLSSFRVARLLESKGRRVSPITLRNVLSTMGYTELGRAGRMIMDEEAKRPTLYRLRHMVSQSDSVDTYCIAQGYKA